MANPIPDGSGVGLRQIEVRGFRSARHADFSPPRLCALVGEARSGKSTLLAAIRAALDPSAAPLSTEDVSLGETGITIRAQLASGTTVTVNGPPGTVEVSGGEIPPVLFLPSSERGGGVIAPPGSHGTNSPAAELFRQVLGSQEGDRSSTGPALGLLTAVERCCAAEAAGLILLIEEPELYLRPQAQRYLYRLLRELSLHGNQVIYSTHSPAFLNVARLDELGYVTRTSDHGTHVLHPMPVAAEEEFRLLNEFDAERGEVFLAHAAVLVEGTTEKLALPFVFQALGHDPDRLGITIVECGGKPGIPFVARICEAVGVPFISMHDRDAPAGDEPNASERYLNKLIAEVAGPDRTIVLVPDFEAIAGVKGQRHKPHRAWKRFISLSPEAMPPDLVRVARLAVSLAETGRA